ncbi:AMP-binding protein [Streptomyces subrutilus]|uniref:AMP-binding protein n=1 Tax=Streptomyces subrutilus TaxID=36818 RepID=UPI00340D3572
MTQGSESSRSDRSTSDTTSDTTATATVLGLFEARVREVPGAPAVVAGSDGLDYGRLDARANRLAHHLLDAGLPAGALVAVATARQTDVVVAVLAVLKAGACYTVIDADTPRTGRRQLAAVRPFALLAHAAQHEAYLVTAPRSRTIRSRWPRVRGW